MRRKAAFGARDLSVVKRAGNDPALMPPGTFVRLNSGSPVGVVTEMMADDRLRVRWLGSVDDSVLPGACVTESSVWAASRYASPHRRS
jgi:hypothetical protein